MCNISLKENSHAWIPRGIANIGFFLNLPNHSCTFIFCLDCRKEKFEKYGWLQQSSNLIISLSPSYVLLLQTPIFLVVVPWRINGCHYKHIATIKLMSLVKSSVRNQTSKLFNRLSCNLKFIPLNIYNRIYKFNVYYIFMILIKENGFRFLLHRRYVSTSNFYGKT